MKKFALTALCAISLPAMAQETAQNSFNPKISLIFDAGYYQDSENGDGASALLDAPGISGGHGHEEEHGGEDHAHDEHGHELSEGFNLREQELTISASIDNYFDGFAVIAFSEDETEIEEAYFTTRRLPTG